MALNGALGMGFLFTAKDEASAAIEKLRGGMEGLKDAGEQAGKSVAGALGMGTKVLLGTAAVLSAVAVGGAFELASSAGRFEKAIASAGAIAGATAKEFTQLRDAAIQAGLAAQFTPVEATKALQDLAAAGFNVKESIGLLKPVLDLAGGSLGQLSPSDAAGLASQAIKAFGISIDDAGISVDRMLQAVNVFALEARELPLALGVASNGAQALHQSLSETLISLGLVKNVIPTVERASTAVAVAMERLADPKTQKALHGIGVAVADTHGNFRSFLDILGDMAPKLDRMNEAQRSAFLLHTFGHHALGGVNAILTQVTNGIKTNTGATVQGAAAVAYLREQFENAGGTAAKFRETMLDTYEGQKQMLSAALDTAAILLGEPIKNTFKDVLKSANIFIRGLIQVFKEGGFSGDVKDALDKHLGIKDFVIGLFVWVTRIRNFFSALGESFRAAFSPFMPVIDAIVVGFREIGYAMGITGQSAEQNGAAFDSAGEAGATLGSILGGVAGILSGVVLTAVDLLAGGVNFMRMAWEAVGPTVMNVWQVVKGVVGLLGGVITGDWRMLWNGFVDVVIAAAKIVVNIILGIVKLIASATDSLNSAFGIKSHMGGFIEDVQKELMAKVDLGATVIKASPSNNPGVAATSASKAAAEATAMPLMSMAPEQHIHMHTDVHLDGEKIGSATSRAKRSSDARSFTPVAAAADGF